MSKRDVKPEYLHPALIEQHRADQHAALQHIADRWKETAASYEEERAARIAAFNARVEAGEYRAAPLEKRNGKK